ncbi:MAG: type VI secretion system contractile sheath small subunit [Planctomycetaceae bacterium]|nr:type VI secretion system contractile sheath small subunit [Planctomycetaceae bacterium]MCP4478606.1 type VI secretion system contractile sheath small subunit [Planctomycetaceae bacterium]MCP4773966.1 type VI secretion system contractile sheath small subunit [Planctomycetaceae bacterium]
MSESHQDRIERFRKPRVHIKYEVDTGGAQIKVDLPFVIGVMGDFSGDPRGEMKSLDDRNFTQIDRNNFDEVLRKLKPGLDLRVENTLSEDESELAVQLDFESMDDFDPTNVAKQVPALKSLLDTRGKLRDLITKIDRSPELEELLTKVLQNQDDLDKLASDIGGGDDTAE